MSDVRRRILDGARPWGSIDIRRDRFGVTRYRLVVYPPGISESERRRVRVARGWPLWGAAVWIVCEVVIGHMAGPWETLALSTAVFFGLGIVAAAMAGRPRRQVRTIAVSLMVSLRDPASARRVDQLKRLAAQLIEADGGLRDGRVTPIGHESVWWRVYDQMEPGHSTATAP